MPGSVKYGKQQIKDWLEKKMNVKTIIDVGCGSGTYAKLLGNKYKYIGIEIWAPYIKQWNLYKYYEQIIIADIRYIKWPKGDCIIFGDVLEHLPKKDALLILDEANRNYKHLILSIPLSDKGFYKGEQHYGNWFEEHISDWLYEFVEQILDWELKLKIKDIGIFAK